MRFDYDISVRCSMTWFAIGRSDSAPDNDLCVFFQYVGVALSDVFMIVFNLGDSRMIGQITGLVMDRFRLSLCWFFLVDVMKLV